MNKKLKGIKSLKMKVAGDTNILMNSLQVVVKSWIENGCDLDTNNITILTIRNYKELNRRLWKKKPFLYLYPNRDDILKPIHGFNDAIRIFNDDYNHQSTKQKKSILLNKLAGFISDSKFMKQEKARYEKTLKPSTLAQGGDIWDAFTIEYNTSYYQSFLCISFDKYVTVA